MILWTSFGHINRGGMNLGQELAFQHAYFIGLGGIGMSAIAEILLDRGFRVSGSDIAPSKQLDKLVEKGVTVHIGQVGENVTEDVDVVVRSTAISDNNPEVVKALALGVPIVHRSIMLSYLMRDAKAICVAGAHGKTTTSSMIALVLERNALDPTIVVGGIINEIGSNAKNGQSEWLVAEADESDGSFVNLLPWYSVITNIEEDHLDHYKDIDEIRSIFRTFVSKNNAQGHILICADCDESMSLKEEAPAPVKTYGFNAAADYVICNHKQEGMRNEADIFYQNKLLGHLVLQIPGDHNITNATAAVIVGMDLGLNFEQCASVLADFSGTRRRFQLAGEVNNIKVIDDYAHHPTEIEKTIAAALAAHDGRVLAVFQPHRYTRTRFLAKEFGKALSGADQVYLLDVYPAGEDPIDGVSSQLIADHIPDHAETEIIAEPDLANHLANVLIPGDMLLVMGAGSIWKQAPQIVDALKAKYDGAASLHA